MNETLSRPACSLVSHFCECRGAGADAVEQKHGRWYVTMGHAGFNTRANNAQGYATERSARAVVDRYQGRTARLEAERAARRFENFGERLSAGREKCRSCGGAGRCASWCEGA